MDKIKPIITNSIGSDKGRNILTILVVILVGLGSFGLGRLSKDATNSGITIKYPNQEANALNSFEQEANSYNPGQNTPKSQIQTQNTAKQSKGSTNSVGKVFFASNRGSKYYSIGCSGGKTLKPENKIYFATEAEAISAGYEKSSSCK
jgi:hypothetical protein